MSTQRPSWSWGSGPDGTPVIGASPLLDSVTWEQAFGGSTGRGVRVAIIDSGSDNDHPAVAGAVRGWVEPIIEDGGGVTYKLDAHEDLFGHGTACAAIIHQIAPEAEIYSVRVLGAKLSGKGDILLAGLSWAINNGMHIANLSLGTPNREYYSRLHELVDEAYYRGTVIVAAANNIPVLSFPSLYSAVISVACYDETDTDDPLAFYCNPSPPVEFGAYGIDVRIAWSGGRYITATGNSFAAPHIAGIVALLQSKHPNLTPFQVKTVLRCRARNVGADPSSAQEKPKN